MSKKEASSVCQLNRDNSLCNSNNLEALTQGKNAYDVIDAVVPGDNVQLLASMHHDPSQLGIDSSTYLLLLQTVKTLSGWGK